MKKESFFSAWRVAGMGVLLALVVVLQAFGGTVSIGAVQLNFTLIPIVLGAIVFGPWIGGFLGLACGVVVLIQVIIGAVPFYALIWTNDPIATTLTCLVKTTAAGIVAGFIYEWISKKNSLVAVFVASGIVPVVNTALFIVGCLFMTAVGGMAGEQNILAFIIYSFDNKEEQRQGQCRKKSLQKRKTKPSETNDRQTFKISHVEEIKRMHICKPMEYYNVVYPKETESV